MLPGLSFSPGQGDQSQPQQQGAQNNPVQEAIKLLSFRLPNNVGQSAIAPQASLAGQGAGFGSQIGGSIAENWLKKLFGGQLGDVQTGGGGFQEQGPALGGAPQGGNPFMDWGRQERGNNPSPPPVGRSPGVNIDFGNNGSQPGPGPTLQPPPAPPQQPPSQGMPQFGRPPITWGGG